MYQYIKSNFIIKSSTIISSSLLFIILSIITVTISDQIFITQNQTSIDINSTQQMLPYHVLPVYGNASLGYYYVNIYIGSPDPQPQSVIVDTGSGILALPCVSCKQCGHKNHINPPYNFQQSLSSKILTCENTIPICRDRCASKSKTDNCSFYIHYAQGSSLQGSLVQDDIRLETIGTNQQIKTIFGCTQKQTKLFFQQKANGIFGLAPRRQSNLLQQLFNLHSPLNGQKRVFSLCLASNNGFMTVGGINTKINQNKTKPDISIPFKDTNNLYNLQGILQIKLGQLLIAQLNTDRLSGYNVIIDSGSTFSYVPSSKYNQIQKLLNNTCISSNKCQIGRGQDSICYRLSLSDHQLLENQLDKIFPIFTISFTNYTLKWLPTRYMLLRNRKKNEVCMALQPLNRYLLGANWMIDRNILFDIDSRTIQIYDNIKCIQQQQLMGAYLNNNPDLKYSNKQSLQYNLYIDINPVFIILGIVLLLFTILIIMLLCISCPWKQQRTMIKDYQEQDQHKNKVNFQQTTVKDSQYDY